MVDFDLSMYLKNGEVHLKDIRVENSRMAGRRSKASYFTKCAFYHVIFDRQFGEDMISFKNCEFVDCMFHGNLKDSYLYLEENLFKNCVFEDISTGTDSDIYYIGDNGFFDCSFKNVKINNETEFCRQVISGGKIENTYMFSSNMEKNQFLDICMENVRINAVYDHNIMDSVTFRNVILEWESQVEPNGSFFYRCDVTGLTCYKHIF